MASLLQVVASVPSIGVIDISTAMLNQVMSGFEKEPLMNNDLVEIAQRLSNTSKDKS